MRTVYTTGVFDVLHPGHLETLKRAARHGDRLVVGVQEDESVFLQKGAYPAMSTQERVAVLSALPFVWKCISYADIDQRPMIKRIKPDVMAQTSEWQSQTDRSEIVAYLAERGIKLVILDIDKKISSSIIKNRIIERNHTFRNDIDVIRKKLAIARISDLHTYEQFDPVRVDLLVKKIKKENMFTEPVTVARYGSQAIVIDGANRFEAAKQVGAKHITVQYVDYANPREVQLRNNVHFLNATRDALLRLFDANGIAYEHVSKTEAMRRLHQGDACALCFAEDAYIALSQKSKDGVRELNALVGAYLNTHTVYRLSELGQEAHAFPAQIIFKNFQPSEIARLAKNKHISLASGVTWHNTQDTVARFRMPLNYLQGNITTARSWLAKEVDRKIEQRHIRYRPSGVYMCDEWGE